MPWCAVERTRDLDPLVVPRAELVGQQQTVHDCAIMSKNQHQNTSKVRWIFLMTELPLIVIGFAASTSVFGNFISMFLEPIDVFLGGNDATDRQQRAKEKHSSPIDVYIPGSGFSGFFYTLGRLEALLHTTDTSTKDGHHEYYCFSAGCLALVTSLMKMPVDHALELANDSRARWLMGDISRYDVVEHFVDGLLLPNVEEEEKCAFVNRTFTGTSEARAADYCISHCCNDTDDGIDCTSQYTAKRRGHNLHHMLPRINIITTRWNHNQFVLSQDIQRPESIEHLKRLLLRTTWIPFITGPSFGHADDDGQKQYDGAIAGLFQHFIHPSKRVIRFDPQQHHFSLLLPWNLDLFLNSLNLHLHLDKALHFWEKGLARGVSK